MPLPAGVPHGGLSSRPWQIEQTAGSHQSASYWPDGDPELWDQNSEASAIGRRVGGRPNAEHAQHEGLKKRGFPHWGNTRHSDMFVELFN